MNDIDRLNEELALLRAELERLKTILRNAASAIAERLPEVEE